MCSRCPGASHGWTVEGFVQGLHDICSQPVQILYSKKSEPLSQKSVLQCSYYTRYLVLHHPSHTHTNSQENELRAQYTVESCNRQRPRGPHHHTDRGRSLFTRGEAGPPSSVFSSSSILSRSFSGGSAAAPASSTADLRRPSALLCRSCSAPCSCSLSKDVARGGRGW